MLSFIYRVICDQWSGQYIAMLFIVISLLTFWYRCNQVAISLPSTQTSTGMKKQEDNTLKEERPDDHKGQTPHQLVQHQIEDQDYHVTDEDMENMDISTELSEQENNTANQEAEELEKDTISTSYDFLD